MQHAVYFKTKNAVFYTTTLHVFTYFNIPKQCGKFLSSLVLSFATCMEGIRGGKYQNIIRFFFKTVMLSRPGQDEIPMALA